MNIFLNCESWQDEWCFTELLGISLFVKKYMNSANYKSGHCNVIFKFTFLDNFNHFPWTKNYSFGKTGEKNQNIVVTKGLTPYRTVSFYSFLCTWFTLLEAKFIKWGTQEVLEKNQILFDIGHWQQWPSGYGVGLEIQRGFLVQICTWLAASLSMQEMWVQSLGQEDPLEKGVATHSSILAGEIPWTEELGGLQSMGHKSQHEWTTKQQRVVRNLPKIIQLDLGLRISVFLGLGAVWRSAPCLSLDYVWKKITKEKKKKKNKTLWSEGIEKHLVQLFCFPCEEAKFTKPQNLPRIRAGSRTQISSLLEMCSALPGFPKVTAKDTIISVTRGYS